MIGSKLALFKELSFSKQKSQFSERTIRTTFVRKDQSDGTPIVSHLGAIRVWVTTRGGVEDIRLEAKAKDTKKKSEAKDSLSEDRHSRGQGQECSRPRTKDTNASVLQQKKRSSKSFQAISYSQAYPGFLILGDLNHKSHAMTSSKIFKRGSFCGTKIS